MCVVLQSFQLIEIKCFPISICYSFCVIQEKKIYLIANYSIFSEEYSVIICEEKDQREGNLCIDGLNNMFKA